MPPLLLYSVNTYLAWAINDRYYNGRHFVWCSEVFDPRARGALSAHASTPPSSNPRDIYLDLRRAAESGDLGSPKIRETRNGIMNGANVNLSNGLIQATTFDEIVTVVDAADIRDYRPLLYVIPYEPMKARVRPVPVARRAHPLSREFVIEDLLTNEFDVIELE